jgi:hypothetical protein
MNNGALTAVIQLICKRASRNCARLDLIRIPRLLYNRDVDLAEAINRNRAMRTIT